MSQTGEHLLGHDHQVFVRAVRPIELQHGELRVVLGRYPFVSEIPVYFEHPLESADKQTLQVQFRGYTKIELATQGMMIRLKGTCGSAAGNRLHHGRLDFQKTVVFQKISQIRNDMTPGRDDLSGRRVDHKIQIALAIARLHVR